MRLNGVLAIMQHLGYNSTWPWKRLKGQGLPFYRDPKDPNHVWAFSDEVDTWDRKRGLKRPRAEPSKKLSSGRERVERGLKGG